MNNRNLLSLSITTMMVAAQAMAADLPVPRAGEIEPIASNCNIGPFEQTGKAGYYNDYCSELTDAEKCLALVKRYMTNEGVLIDVGHDRARTQYCLKEFQKGLLGQ